MKRMRQVWRYLPALGAALFAPTVLFIMAPNSVILLNMKEIGYDWGLVVIFLQAFAVSALLCALAFVLALRSKRFAWLPRLVILLGVSVLLWDALSPLLDTWGKSMVGGLLIEGVAFAVVALVLFRLKLDNLFFIFGAIAPVLLISGVVSHYTTVKAAQTAYDADRSAGAGGPANAVATPEAGTSAQSGGATGQWRLVRYEVDEDQLARDEPADLKLYWMPLPGVEPVPSADFYRQADGEWVQVIRQVRSLVPGGGFEQAGALSSFPNDLFKTPAETRQVVADTRNGQATKVGVLRNSSQYKQTSLVSASIAVNPKRLYLQAGWLHTSAGGVGYLGRLWLPKGGYDSFVKSDSPNWFHYDQIIQPPPDATQVQIGAANLNSTGQVYCDDLIFVEMGQIDDAACQPAAPGSPLRCGPPLRTNVGNSTPAAP
jgi:hypothetical protein